MDTDLASTTTSLTDGLAADGGVSGEAPTVDINPDGAGRLDSNTQIRDVQHVDGFWAPIFVLIVIIIILIKIYLYAYWVELKDQD